MISMKCSRCWKDITVGDGYIAHECKPTPGVPFPTYTPPAITTTEIKFEMDKLLKKGCGQSSHDFLETKDGQKIFCFKCGEIYKL